MPLIIVNFDNLILQMICEMDIKNIPRWNDPNLNAGTKIRTALWLLSEVGVGNLFTKEQHRLAFPGVAQADRRLRDLRDNGWVIQTNREDVSLKPDEQRFAAVGIAIWDPSARQSTPHTGASAKTRRAVFLAAGYQCEVCGVAGGESYPDLPTMTATLSLSVVNSGEILAGGATQYIVECKRCRAGGGIGYKDVAALISEISKLPSADREALAYLTGQKAAGALFTLWANYRHLAEPDKRAVRANLCDSKTV